MCVCIYIHIYIYACMLRHFCRVWLFATLLTVGHQAPLSVGFPWQGNWSGLPYSSGPRDRTHDFHVSCTSRWALTTSTTWEAMYMCMYTCVCVCVCVYMPMCVYACAYRCVYIYVKYFFIGRLGSQSHPAGSLVVAQERCSCGVWTRLSVACGLLDPWPGLNWRPLHQQADS